MEPAVVLRRKHSVDETTDLNLCTICQKNIKGQNLRSTADGSERLRQAANERWWLQDYDNIDVIDRLRVAEPTEESRNTEVQYHKNCYSVFTSATVISRLKKVEGRAKSSQEEMPGPSNEPRRASRRSIPPLNKKLCIFCQTDTGKATCLLMQIDVSKEIMEAAKKDFVMRSRLTNIIDLVADDAINHPQCKVEFLRKANTDQSDEATKPETICFKKLVGEIRLGLARGDVYTLPDVWQRYAVLLDTEFGLQTGSYKDCKKGFKLKLENSLPGEIEFVPQLDPTKP